jgi:hypothetical protein
MTLNMPDVTSIANELFFREKQTQTPSKPREFTGNVDGWFNTKSRR